MHYPTIFFMLMSILYEKNIRFSLQYSKKAYIAPEISKEKENGNRILITLRISK